MADYSRRYHRSEQREAIHELVRASRSHPTAEEIFSRLKHQYPRLSIGTVYRNLHILAAQGELLELQFGTGSDRFDGRLDPHYHLVCRRCGDISDVEMDVHAELLAEARARAEDFQVESHTVAFYGLCQACQGASPY
jgi:Fur family peroxide stress response transcriptional regulator